MNRPAKLEKREWPADRVERRPIAALRAYGKNARTHSKGQVEQLAASMMEWGWTTPVLVDPDGMIIAGHGRVEAARSLGWDEVPVMVATGWTDDQIAAYVIADNKLAMNAGWDRKLLAAEMTSLAGAGVDLSLLGFAADEMQRLLGRTLLEGQSDPDTVPPASSALRTTVGDVWRLGPHILTCGDSTDPDVVARAVGGRKVSALFTDPPYNVAYVGGTGLTIQNDAMAPAAFRAFLAAAMAAADRHMAAGAAFYICHADSERMAFQGAVEAAGLQVRQTIIWVKNTFVMGRQDYHWQHEPILYGWKDGAAHTWVGPRTLSTLIYDDEPELANLKKADLIAILSGLRETTTVVRVDKPRRSAERPTMKPVKLITHLLANSIRAGEVVLDTFGGSGSTLIACEQLGAEAAVVELDPKYCDVILARWEAFTGQTAVLERA